MLSLIEYIKLFEKSKDSPDWELLNHDSHEHMEKHYAIIRKHHGDATEKRHREQDANTAQGHRNQYIQSEPTHKLAVTLAQNGRKLETGTHLRHNRDKKTGYTVMSGIHSGKQIKAHPHQVEKL